MILFAIVAAWYLAFNLSHISFGLNAFLALNGLSPKAVTFIALAINTFSEHAVLVVV